MAADPEGTSASASSQLGVLADPRRRLSPLDLSGQSREWLSKALDDMLTIRFAEEAIGSLVEQGVARAPCHLGIGQEAVAVGVASQLRKTDRIFGGHRSHSHFLAVGGDVYSLIAEVLGKVDGASRGMGGSMHLLAQSVGFHGSVPIVGATIPIATGAGLAAKLDGRGDVAVAFFGDGATEEGVFHESMNFAAAQRLPVLFVCENNLFSSHLDITLRQPSDRIARYADAHMVKALTVDGNDVVAVMKAAAELVTHSRSGQGPGFVEAITYRHRGHVGPKEDIDVGVRRTMADVDAWKALDPIRRLKAALLAARLATSQQFDERERQIRQRIGAACDRAKRAEYPPLAALLGAVFAEHKK